MEVKLRRFEGLSELVDILVRWERQGTIDIEKPFQEIAHKMQAEAVRRVPVDEGHLVERILQNVYRDGPAEITAEVGTNVLEYPIYLEFGTEHIAGGDVLAIGDNPIVTDAEAVHDWAAKRGDAIDETRFAPAGPGESAQEQMPWLRPTFTENRQWALDRLDFYLRPPRGNRA